VAVTSQQSRVRERDVLFKKAIMSNVTASHQISKVTHYSLPRNPSVNRYELSDYATVPNLDAKLLLFTAVLWR
jgi:hypothetical protein